MTEEQTNPGEPPMRDGGDLSLARPPRPPRPTGRDPRESERDPLEAEAAADDDAGSDVVDKTDMSAVGDDGQVFGG